LARNRSLHGASDERRDDRGDQADDENDDSGRTGVVAAAAAATPEGNAEEDIGDEADRDHQAEDDERDADVVVLHVAHLVGHDAFELLVVHEVEETGRGSDDRVLRVTAGGKRVRCHIVDDVDLRHGQALGDGEVFDDAIQARVVGLLDLACATERESLSRRQEVLEDRVADRDDDRDDADRPVWLRWIGVPAGERAEPADDQEEHQDDEDGVALIPRYSGVHLRPERY
jgi:hypothetical protein